MPIPGGPRPATPVTRTLAQVAEHLGPGRPPGAESAELDPVAAAVVISGISLSSRTVRAGDLYAALPGLRAHGADYLTDAVAHGAVAVLTDVEGARRCGEAARAQGVPVLVVDAPRALLGGLAAWLYADPGAALLTLGVTGTNGKTTTTFLLDAALRAAGRTTGLVGTIEIRVGDERLASTGTTPEAPDLHALLAVMRERGVSACSMEISSHALAQHRVDGLVVDVAGFTNLSQDHLDYHRTMDEYFAAKAQLFTPEHARTGVVCVDDAWGRRLAAQASIPVVRVATRPPAADDTVAEDTVADNAVADDTVAVVAADWTVLETSVLDGTPLAVVRTPTGRTVPLHCPLPGAFNVENCVVALAMLVAAGLDVDAAAAALAAAGSVPGRMERVGLPADEPAADVVGVPLAVVDYAHTPDAVAAAAGALHGSGRPLVVVLGAGGDRDRDKRPLMGAAAAERADVVIVTDDNPRSEDPEAIRAAVLAGARQVAFRTGSLVLEVADRGHAIGEAVARAWGAPGTSGGVVLVAGKGHEQGQDVAGTVHPFDDRRVLSRALAAAALERGRVDPVDPVVSRTPDSTEVDERSSR